MDVAVDVSSLNERAQPLGYEVIGADDPVGVGSLNLGQGPWVWVLRDGRRAFRFPWRGEEVAQWLRFRERER